MSINDWSSDLCSSDLRFLLPDHRAARAAPVGRHGGLGQDFRQAVARPRRGPRPLERGAMYGLLALPAVGLAGPFRPAFLRQRDRKSVVWGKSMAVRVDPGGSRLTKKKT